MNHKNNVRHDNRVDNLEWCTHKENTKHAIKSGTIHKLKYCKRGLHRLVGDNVRITNKGRACRACDIAYKKKRYREQLQRLELVVGEMKCK